MPFPLIPLAIGAGAAWLGKKVYDTITEEDSPEENSDETQPSEGILFQDKIQFKDCNLDVVMEIKYSDLLGIFISNEEENKDLRYTNKIGSAIEALAQANPEDIFRFLIRGGALIVLQDIIFVKDSDLDNPKVKHELRHLAFESDSAEHLLTWVDYLEEGVKEEDNAEGEDDGPLAWTFTRLEEAINDSAISATYLKHFINNCNSSKKDRLDLYGYLGKMFTIISLDEIYSHLGEIKKTLQRLLVIRDPKLQNRLNDFLLDNRGMVNFAQYLLALCDDETLDDSERYQLDTTLLNIQTLFSKNNNIDAYHYVSTLIESDVSHESSLARVKGAGFIDKDAELGRSENDKHRQVIVCSDQPRTLSDGKLPGILCAYAEDLVEYNESVSSDLQLKFEIGHPQNGVVYVQHPLRKNVYFDVDSFHAAMLTEKYEELKHLLQYLGARKISATVIHEDNVATSEKRTRSVKSDNEFAKVGVHGNVNWEGCSTEEVKLYKKLSSEEKFNVGGEPSIPENLIFYPHESAWQRIAEGALKSIYNECDITLEYRQDYAVNQQKMLDVETKVRVFIPSFELNIGTSFESNLRRITSTIWNYKVEFGNATSAVGFSRCEQTFVKRARRYAANDGRIDAEEREDLVKLAETLGIDAIRMEELIEEAFE